MSTPIDLLHNKLFSQMTSSSHFRGINTKKLEEIKKQVEQFKKNNPIASKNGILSKEFLTYYKTIEYLTSPNIGLKLPSFDEKIAFLILSIDPECEVYKLYLTYINLINEKTKYDISSIIRNRIGTCNNQLLIMERLFVLKFIFTNQISLDYSILFSALSKNVTSFDNITDARFEEIQSIATPINVNTNNILDFMTKSKLLDNENIEDNIILFICTVDPDLNLLQIYNEECMQENIQLRCLNEVGFYFDEIIRLEKLYHIRFYPEKEVDPWTKQKRKF